MATDVQGVRVCKPFYEKAGVTFPALVDRQGALGRAMGFTIIPNEFYFDEKGRYRGRIDSTKNERVLLRMLELEPPAEEAGPDPAPDPPQAAEVEQDEFASVLAAGKRMLDEKPDAAAAYLRRATELNERSVDAHVSLAAVLLSLQDKQGAVESLRKALALKPDDWLIRKQIWAIEHPEEFYDGSVNFAWQREQMRREGLRN